jgi:hypothetical protein
LHLRQMARAQQQNKDFRPRGLETIGRHRRPARRAIKLRFLAVGLNSKGPYGQKQIFLNPPPERKALKVEKILKLWQT